VVLTLIGGGVFGNPEDEIWAAILFAVAEAEKLATDPLEVIVNTFVEPTSELALEVPEIALLPPRRGHR
jgi:hypothetical protein